MYKNMTIKEVKKSSLLYPDDYHFLLVIDEIPYFLFFIKNEHIGFSVNFAHREDRCIACKGEPKQDSYCFNLFTFELYRDIIEHMFSSSTIRMRLLTTYHDLYEDLKEELVFIRQLEEGDK
jgi:hypothetical protein